MWSGLSSSFPYQTSPLLRPYAYDLATLLSFHPFIPLTMPSPATWGPLLMLSLCLECSLPNRYSCVLLLQVLVKWHLWTPHVILSSCILDGSSTVLISMGSFEINSLLCFKNKQKIIIFYIHLLHSGKLLLGRKHCYMIHQSIPGT